MPLTNPLKTAYIDASAEHCHPASRFRSVFAGPNAPFPCGSNVPSCRPTIVL